MSRDPFRDWTETDFGDVKPGAIVQNEHTMRYAEVVEEPDSDAVKVQNADGVQVWMLETLSYYRKPANKVAIFGGTS